MKKVFALQVVSYSDNVFIIDNKKQCQFFCDKTLTFDNINDAENGIIEIFSISTFKDIVITPVYVKL